MNTENKKDKKGPKPITMKDVKAKAEEKKCPVQQSMVFIEEFLSEPMCGKCFPCSFGSYEARIRLQKIAGGTGADNDIDSLKRITSNMLETSRCKKGKDTAAFIKESMESGKYNEHLSGSCSNKECNGIFEYVIIPEKCTICGICRDVCKDNAITGEKKKPYLSGYLPFEIAQKRCTKCGECIKVCPTEAIIIVDVKSREPAGV